MRNLISRAFVFFFFLTVVCGVIPIPVFAEDIVSEGVEVSIVDQSEQEQEVQEEQLYKVISSEVKALCVEFNMEPREFFASPAGFVLTIYTIWNISGATALMGLIVVGILIVWSFRHFHMSKKVKDKKGKTVYVRRHKFSKRDEGNLASIILHLIAFAFTVATFLDFIGILS